METKIKSIGTITLYLQKENLAGLCPLQVWYRYARVTTSFSVGHSVKRSDVDFAGLKIKRTCKEYLIINQKINGIVAKLKTILSEAQVEPSIEYVKDKYQKFEHEQLILRRQRIANEFVEEIVDEEKKACEAKRAELETHPFYQYLAPGLEKRKKESVQEMKNLFERYVKSKLSLNQNKRIAASSLKSYRSTLSNMCAFAESKQFKKLNTSFTVECMNMDFYYALHSFGLEKNWMDSHFGNQIKNWKMFLYWCQKQGMKVHHQFKDWEVPKTPRSYPLFLTWDDLELLWQYSLQTKLAHERYRLHLLIFGCLTGLRYSDIEENDFVIETDKETEREYLVAQTKKNRSQTYFYIYDERIKQILEMYEYNLNLVSQQKFNSGIKETLDKVFKLHNIHQQILTVHSFQGGEKVVLKQGTLAQLFSSHDCRRNCLSLLVKVFGWSIEDVSLMIGSRDQKSVLGYVKSNSSLNQKRLSRLTVPLRK